MGDLGGWDCVECGSHGDLHERKDVAVPSRLLLDATDRKDQTGVFEGDNARIDDALAVCQVVFQQMCCNYPAKFFLQGCQSKQEHAREKEMDTVQPRLRYVRYTSIFRLSESIAASVASTKA